MAREQKIKKIDNFQKKTKINESLGLDERDNMILALLQKNPNMPQSEIGEKVKLSQPSVGARIQRLKKKGILAEAFGINFSTVDLSLGKVDVYATDTKQVINEFKDCPFFLNALITSGRYNICLFFMATDLKRLEGIVNKHLRNNDKVKDVELNIIISTARDFILPTNIDFDNKKQMNCGQDCDCI